jgi:DNA-binding PadR family transcriptional regulator
MEDKLIRDLFLGFIKVHILHHAGKDKIFGSEFQKELARHGYDISYGTLYPIFHRLEMDGYIKSEKKNVNGKIRKYYTITQKGKSTLNKARKKSEELFLEIRE